MIGNAAIVNTTQPRLTYACRTTLRQKFALSALFCAALTTAGACGRTGDETATSQVQWEYQQLPGDQTAVATIEGYNASLPKFGVPFDDFNLSLYTGFAPRVSDPNAVHIRLSRGNVIRVTATVDSVTALSYLFELDARAQFYDELERSGKINAVYADLLPKFYGVIASPEYNIRPTLEAFRRREIGEAELRRRAERVMAQLNPGRIFPIRVDLERALRAWHARLDDHGAGGGAHADTDAVNDMIPGRINALSLTADEASDLRALRAMQPGGTEFMRRAIDLVHKASRGRYRDAISCGGGGGDSGCMMTHLEFTQTYPTGSANSLVSDGEGNRIPIFPTIGGFKFTNSCGGGGVVDRARGEESVYYGWQPKLDYECNGNGLHNPAVDMNMHRPEFRSAMAALGFDRSMMNGTIDRIWTIARGPISNGCTRVGSGAIWEIRHIFPADPARIVEIPFFMQDSRFYDVFDVHGDGQPEVMGSDYRIHYTYLTSAGVDAESRQDARRVGKSLTPGSLSDDPTQFYGWLYGANQFRTSGGRITMTHPTAGTFYATGGGAGAGNKVASFSPGKRYGELPLFEQANERDKIQFYQLRGSNAVNKGGQIDKTWRDVAQLMGRVTSCGPFEDDPRFARRCYGAEFRHQAQRIFDKL